MPLAPERHLVRRTEAEMKLLAAVMLLVVSPLGAGTAFADSDGYYCVGHHYIAYQFGFAAPPIGPHRLYVVRFGGPAGIEPPTVLDLPQFQVQGILCGEGTVQLAAYDAIYTVRLDASNRPIGYEAVPWEKHQNTPPQFVGHSLNLGSQSRTARDLKQRRETIGEAAGGGQYLLEITATPISSDPCSSMVTTRLVRTDRNGREVQQVELFNGRGIRDCGEVSTGQTKWGLSEI